MKIREILKELEVRSQYAGRGLAVPNKTAVWQVITYPKFIGSLITLHDSTTLKNNQVIGKSSIMPHDGKFTHKRQLSDFYDVLNLGVLADKMNLEKREFINHTYEKNPRGRILNEDGRWILYIWDYGASQKMGEKAIDSVINKLPPEYLD